MRPRGVWRRGRFWGRARAALRVGAVARGRPRRPTKRTLTGGRLIFTTAAATAAAASLAPSPWWRRRHGGGGRPLVSGGARLGKRLGNRLWFGRSAHCVAATGRRRGLGTGRRAGGLLACRSRHRGFPEGACGVWCGGAVPASGSHRPPSLATPLRLRALSDATACRCACAAADLGAPASLAVRNTTRGYPATGRGIWVGGGGGQVVC